MPKGPTKRRPETRRRLLDAALAVFAEKGFNGARIEDVCAAAGYTRGAFYSNFATKEELFFALFDDHAARVLDRFRRQAEALVSRAGSSPRESSPSSTLDAPGEQRQPTRMTQLARHAQRGATVSDAARGRPDSHHHTQPAAGMSVATNFRRRTLDDGPLSIEGIVEALADIQPDERTWYLVTTEFTLSAIRDPAAAGRLAEHDGRLRAAAVELLTDLLNRAGRGLKPDTDAEELVRVLIAIREGGLAQSYVEPERLPPGTLERRFVPVLLAAVTEA